jgi:hypothetical protein
MRPFFISPSLSLTLLPENTPPLKCVFRQKVLLCSLKYVLFFLILAFHVSVSYCGKSAKTFTVPRYALTIREFFACTPL